MQIASASAANELAAKINSGDATVAAPRTDKSSVIMHTRCGEAKAKARKIAYKDKATNTDASVVIASNATGESPDGTIVNLNVYNLCDSQTENGATVKGSWGLLGLNVVAAKAAAQKGGAGSTADLLLKWVIQRTGKDQPTDAELEAVRFPGMLVA